MPLCYIALGGNSGSVADTFRDCLDELHSTAEISLNQVSSFLSTASVGDAAGDEFLNAAAALRTELPPLELLDLLQTLESRYGRKRGRRWGPRPLDLDLIFYGEALCELPRLTVPHPACWYRRFVLDPLVEIAADFRHPVKGITVSELQSRLLPRPLTIAVAGGDARTRHETIERLRRQFPSVALSEWSPNELSAVIAWLGPQEGEIPFEQLPSVPRLDISCMAGNRLERLSEVIHSALGG